MDFFTRKRPPPPASPQCDNLVQYYGKSESDHCGYCNVGPSITWGMTAEKLSCEGYQELIDRGWRRSGTYLYKPNLKTTCCPAYTIRLDTLKFRPAKGHKNLIKRMKKLATLNAADIAESIDLGEDQPNEMKESSSSSKSNNSGSSEQKTKSKNKATISRVEPSYDTASSSQVKTDVQDEVDSISSVGNTNEPTYQQSKKQKRPKKEGLAQLASRGELVPDFTNMFAGAISTNPKAQDLVTVDTVRAAFSEEDFALYCKYQVAVHGDSPSSLSKSGYMRFLVTSPLQYEKREQIEYGSFHQHYRLNGKLVAVGVIDILPRCVSSVYVYYDPDLRHLALGVFSALQEIAFILSLHKNAPNLHYYYMGFYIHSCPKMRYKAQYHPSELLELPTSTWVPMDTCSAILDQNTRAIYLHKDPPPVAGLGLPLYDPENKIDNPSKEDMEKTNVSVSGAVMPLSALQNYKVSLYLAECSRLIGRRVHQKTIFNV